MRKSQARSRRKRKIRPLEHAALYLQGTPPPRRKHGRDSKYPDPGANEVWYDRLVVGLTGGGRSVQYRFWDETAVRTTSLKAWRRWLGEKGWEEKIDG